VSEGVSDSRSGKGNGRSHILGVNPPATVPVMLCDPDILQNLD
ncbi:unnamed protein product, partial [marine sediment metagenome]